MRPEMITKEAFTVVGLELVKNQSNEEFPKLWERFSGRVEELKPFAVKPINAYGICSNFDMAENTFDYMAGLEVGERFEIPEGMTVKRIPNQTYAVFQCTLPSLMDTIKSVYDTWLPSSEYKRSPNPEFEYYDKDFDPQIPESPLYLYIPVEPR